MSPKLKRILNFVLIFGTLAIVLLVGFSGSDFNSALSALRQIPFLWIIFCVLAYAGYLTTDALAVYFFLKHQGCGVPLGYAILVSIVGQYYSNITPGATGGQPMQIYYLKKRDVPIGLGTSAMLVKLFCFQFMLLVLGTGFWIAHAGFIAENVGGNMWILLVGYLYNAVVVVVLLLVAVNRRLVRFLADLVLKIGTKLHLVKNPAGTRTKWEDTLETYHSSIMMLAHRPWDLVVQLLIGGLQLIVLMMVIVSLYFGFGLHGSSVGQLIAMGIMLYTSASYTPLPGASGAQEGVFALYFSRIFPDDIRLMALLLWRFFTYYLSLMVGAVATVGFGFRKDKKLQ